MHAIYVDTVRALGNDCTEYAQSAPYAHTQSVTEPAY